MAHRHGERSPQCTLLTAAVLVGLGGCAADAQDLEGMYEVAFPTGLGTLSVALAAHDEAAGWLRTADGTIYQLSGTVVVDEERGVTLVGTMQGPATADFAFFAEGDDGTLGLLVVPYDEGGRPQAGASAVYPVTRTSLAPAELPRAADLNSAVAEPATPHPQKSFAGPSRDPRFMGVWSTQVVMNSEVGSVATQMFMEFTADGTMRDLGSRTVGGLFDSSMDTGLEPGGENASWRTEGDLLWVSQPGTPWVPLARYAFPDTRLYLVFPDDGSQQIWSRVQ